MSYSTYVWREAMATPYSRQLRGEPVPFLVELRDYVLSKDADFVNYIVSRSNDFYAAALDADSVGGVLAQDGKAIVFFDGLDEIFDPNERRRVIDQFRTFARRYPGAYIVVTSRIAGYERTSLGLAGFEHYTLMPLTLGHIRHFAERWYRHYTLEGTERTAQGLVQRIVESPRLLDLAGNPMLLDDDGGDLQGPRSAWRALEAVCTLRRDVARRLGRRQGHPRPGFQAGSRHTYHSEIRNATASLHLYAGAPSGRKRTQRYRLRAIAGYHRELSEEEIPEPPGEADAIAVDILRHLMERTYVLAGIGERVFGFVHRTFMEYFAAYRYLAEFNARKSDFAWLTRDIFEAHWQMPEWEEVLLLLTAMLHGQSTQIHDVVEYLRSECRADMPFNVAFASRCLGEAGDMRTRPRASIAGRAG